MNFQTMNKQRKFILIAAAVGIIAMFLPWVRFSFMGLVGGSVNGMHSWGILAFLGFVAAGGVTLLGDQTKTLDKTFWMVALIGGGLSALICIIYFLNAIDAINFISVGFYLALIASLGVLYSAYQYRALGYSIKDGFDSLKNDIEKKANNNDTTPPPPIV